MSATVAYSIVGDMNECAYCKKPGASLLTGCIGTRSDYHTHNLYCPYQNNMVLLHFECTHRVGYPLGTKNFITSNCVLELSDCDDD